MSPREKVQTIEQVSDSLRRQRESSPGLRVVHCHGVFDLLHIGHIRYLQRARALGDLLVVTVTPDGFVNKGPHRPAFQDKLRVDALAALDCVDYAAVNQWPTACEAIRLLRPDVYAKGGEFLDRKTPELLQEESAAAEVGAAVEFIEEFTSSSSHLLNKYLSPFEDDAVAYLGEFRGKFGLDDVIQFVRRAAELRILVVGETIIDEYYSCSAIGRSAKAPILATRYDSHERFAGGAAAVANHLAPFCKNVDLLTMLGRENSEEQWVREHLRAGVDASFFFRSGAPTIVKRRYRETYFGTPLFAINFLSDNPLGADEDATLTKMLADRSGDYDAVIVADYGHQMLTPSAIQSLCDHARFLSVNTQANAANTGFHTISKYPRADFVSLAERELQLECRSRTADIREQLVEVGQRLYASMIVVTLGKQGCLCYGRRSGYHRAASLATNIVDRVGAGDAFFALASLCAALDAPPEILAFLGNVAGAEAVAVVGNSRTLDPDSLERHVTSLFK